MQDSTRMTLDRLFGGDPKKVKPDALVRREAAAPVPGLLLPDDPAFWKYAGISATDLADAQTVSAAFGVLALAFRRALQTAADALRVTDEMRQAAVDSTSMHAARTCT